MVEQCQEGESTETERQGEMTVFIIFLDDKRTKKPSCVDQTQIMG